MALLTLAEAKAQLDIDSTSHDEELQSYIEGLTDPIEAIVGPVVQQAVTETHETPACGARVLVLRQAPVVSLTTVEAVYTGGTSYAVDSLTVDETTGTVRRLDGGRMYGTLRITYTAGRTQIPETIKMAAKILLQHMWRTQYGAARGNVGGSDDFDVNEPVVGWGYAIPNRVLQLLERYKTGPAVG